MPHPSKVVKLAVGLALCVLMAACVALRAAFKQESGRGLIAMHAVHKEQGMGCTDCHDATTDPVTIPNHEVCSLCHEIPEDQPPAEACGLCHTRADCSVTPRKARLREENIFAHEPHLAVPVACDVCHIDPDKRPYPGAGLMGFCMDCHGKTDAALNKCEVCHRELRETVAPRFRGERRLPHDSPEIWERVHGRESRFDPAFCAICHEQERDCVECHRKTKPADHTVAWRRKPHGLRATWDRAKCTACHEEDFCIKCHQNTKPTSHRAGFGRPLNTHCVRCHYPAERTNCTVCHERIEHSSALPSPHVLAVYPANCSLCHPGGLPHEAPHLPNSTVGCLACHN